MKQYPFQYKSLARELNRMARGIIERAKEEERRDPRFRANELRQNASHLRRAAKIILSEKERAL